MAVRESLEFDLRAALSQLDQLERQIEDFRRPINLDLDVTGDAAQEIQTIDNRLENIVEGTRQVNRELSEMETAASASVQDFTNIEGSLESAERAAQGLSLEVSQAESAASRLDAETADVSRHLDQSEDEATRLTAELNRADRAADSINVTAGTMAGRFASIKTAALGMGAALAGIGGGVILGGALRGANAAVQAFAQLEDSVNAVNVVFGEGAEKVLEFGENAARSAGLSETAFNQAVVPIGSLLQNFGFDAEKASEASIVLVQRAADLASVMGGTVQEALLAVGAALRGEADPLERYGASVSAARVEQFALANELARTKAEITPAITLQARYGLILEDTARVQGDFANTAGDLANLQRSAAAEAANFGTDLGEVLAPAMETIVGLLPDMLEGLRLLVPGFAAGADSAAEFFESLGEGGGFRTEFAAIEAGFDAATTGGGLFFEAIRTGTDLFQGDLKGAGDSVTRLSGLFARSLTRGIAVQFANSLDEGTDAVVAFTDAVTDVGKLTSNFDTFKDSYREFAVGAGLSEEQLSAATLELLNNADALGLTAEEVIFLREQLELLNVALSETANLHPTGGRPLEIEIDFPDPSRFATFTSALEELPAQINSVTVNTRTAAAALGQSLNPFDQAPEDIQVSARQFFQNVTEEINREAEFQAGIVELILAGHFNLARMIGEQGPAAQRALTGFLGDLDLAAATEAALTTGQTDTSTAVGEALEEAIAAAPPGPARQALIDLMTDGVIDSPEVEAAIVSGTARAATTTVDGYSDALASELSTMDPTIFERELADLFSGVTFDIGIDQFNFPDSGAFQGTIGVGAVFTGSGGGGTTVINNIYNPTTTDLPTNVAQANQSTAATGTLLNRVANT